MNKETLKAANALNAEIQHLEKFIENCVTRMKFLTITVNSKDDLENTFLLDKGDEPHDEADKNAVIAILEAKLDRMKAKFKKL